MDAVDDVTQGGDTLKADSGEIGTQGHECPSHAGVARGWEESQCPLYVRVALGVSNYRYWCPRERGEVVQVIRYVG